jgi:hypothetical protein
MSAADQVNVVEETVKLLKKNEGFHSYVLFKDDGIVIRWENMEYKRALHYTANVLSLVEKTEVFVRNLLDPIESQVESIRLNVYEFDTERKHEVIVCQVGNYLMLCVQKELALERAEEGAKPPEEE